MNLFFIERLSVSIWLFHVLPRLIGRRLFRRRTAATFYVIDASRIALSVARGTAGLAGVKVEKLAFRLVELRDADGVFLNFRIIHQDEYDLVDLAKAGPAYEDIPVGAMDLGRFPLYLDKTIVGEVSRRAIYLIQVCVWKSNQLGASRNAVEIFLECRPWSAAITQYAAGFDVKTTFVPVVRSPRILARLLVRSDVISRLAKTSTLQPIRTPEPPDERSPRESTSGTARGHGPAPKIVTEFMGNLNLDRPEQHSELFFWQESSLQGSDLTVTFGLPNAPLDAAKLQELTAHDMRGVALNPSSTTLLEQPVYASNRIGNRRHKLVSGISRRHGTETDWINREYSEYRNLVDYWAGIFDAVNAKVFVTWHKHAPAHLPLAEALQSRGGVTAIFQRSFESDPADLATVGPNVIFGYSRAPAELPWAEAKDSLYWVCTGYLGDHRYPLLLERASEMRRSLEANGAQRIVAFYDDNSGDDPRWTMDHQWIRDHYYFLLNKVLEEPWFGLLIKPKRPSLLRQRLGPVAQVLRAAEETGRCHVYESGEVFGAHPPVEAALAADVAVDSKLFTGSAGMDAALAGVPTLFMDRERWLPSPFYRLGLGNVVFRSWDDLWDACREHWSSNAGVPGFGDWSPMLAEMDPYRDGRAAHRMGEYLKWLIEGFQQGHDREQVMADAAQRFGEIWGFQNVAGPTRHGTITSQVAG